VGSGDVAVPPLQKILKYHWKWYNWCNFISFSRLTKCFTNSSTDLYDAKQHYWVQNLGVNVYISPHTRNSGGWSPLCPLRGLMPMVKATTSRWQVTLCDPIWHVISHSGEVISITNCYILTFTSGFHVYRCQQHLCQFSDVKIVRRIVNDSLL